MAEDNVLISIVKTDGGYAIQRSICPELVAMLVIELEIAKTMMVNMAMSQLDPTNRPDPVGYPPDGSKGDGH